MVDNNNPKAPVSVSHDRKLKMVWITGAWPPDIMGPAIGIADRAQWFDKHSPFEVTCIIPRQQDGSVERSRVKNIRTYDSKPWPIAVLFRAPTIKGGRQIAKIVREIKPDIIMNGDLERVYLLTSWSIPGRFWAKKNKVPYLGYYHTDYISFASLHPIWSKLGFAVRMMMHHCYHKLDATLVPTAAAGEKAYKAGANPDRIIPVKFDGVNTDLFTPENYSPEELAKYLGYTPQGPVLLSFSRISPEKRINHIIDVLEVLHKTPGYEETTLIIAGNGEKKFEDALQKYASKIERQDLIHIIGPVRGTLRTMLLASVDVLLSASPYETLGISILEAMSSHTPIVCVDSGAPASYIQEGKTGFIAKTNDVSSLIEVTKRALAADRHAIGVLSRKHVVENFSLQSTCEELSDFYYRFLHDPSYRPPVPDSPLFTQEDNHNIDFSAES